MGKIADIVNSPEFAAKTPVEKAQARRDLFMVALDDHPEIKAKFDAADPNGRQQIVDQFKAKLDADFPEAFTTRGYHITIDSDGNQEAKEARVPIYDVATEQVLSHAAPKRDRGERGLGPWQADASKFAELSPEQRRAMAPFIYERYGENDMLGGDGKPMFGEPQDFIQRDESTGRKVFNFLGPAALRIAPPLIASTTKNPKAVAVAAGAGDAAAQALEQMIGTRDKFSPTELGLNTVLSMVPAAAVKNIANPALNMAARVGIRAAEGAAQGAIFEGVRSKVDEGKVDLGSVAAAGGFGAVLGGVIGGFEPKIAAMLAGKNAQEASATLTSAIEKAKPEERAALQSAQHRIDELLRVNAEPKSAAESAVALSAEHPPVVNSARESAEAMAPQLAANERRAGDFSKARAEEAGQVIRDNQLAGDESTVLSGDPVKDQQTILQTRPGDASREQERLAEKLNAKRPSVDDGSIPNDVKLSPQAQSIYEQYGFISPRLAGSLAGGVGGFVAGSAQNPEGDTPEERLGNRIKNGLIVGVLGAGGGYMLGSRFSTVQPVATKPGTILADVDKVLTPPQRPSLLQRAKEIPTALRTQFITQFAPLDKLASNVEKANNVILRGLPLARQFEQVAGAGGKAVIDVKDFDASVGSAIKGNEQDFDRLLFLKRTGQRLQWNQQLAAEKARIRSIPASQRTPQEVATLAKPDDLKRVADWTLDKVDTGLAELEKKLGARRFAELDQTAAGAFQQELDKTLQLQVASGRMSQETYNAIKASNDFYAPFRVLTAMERFENVTGGAGIDTRKQLVHAIEGIDDTEFRLDSPTKAAMENIFNGRILAEKNLKMLELAKLADADKTGTFIRRLKTWDPATKTWEEPRRGYATVNYFENGTPMRLEVSPDVADAVKGLNVSQTGLATDFASIAMNRTKEAARTALRFGATGANVGFQIANLAFADQPRLALVSKYGVGAGGMADSLQYASDFVHALYDSAMGNIVGRPTELYRQFYESGAAGATIQDAISPAMARRAAGLPGATSAVRRNTIGRIEDLAKAVEETTKLMGFRRGLRVEGFDDLALRSPAAAQRKLEEIVAEVRNFSGSPDFARHGASAQGLNLLFMFFNARLQGVAADAGRLFGKDGTRNAAAAWVRLGTAVGVPAAGAWFMNQQPENAEDFAKVPQWERENYVMIPRYGADGKPLYFTNAEGDKVREYWRVQKRESMKLFANLVESSLDFAKHQDADGVKRYGMSFLENVSPVNIEGKNGRERLESVIGSMNPLVKTPYEVASNRDTFRHRNIVPEAIKNASPENQYRADTPDAYVQAARTMPQMLWDPLRSPLMLEQLVNSTTGGVISQLTPTPQPADRDQTAAALAKNPASRRFVRSQQVNHDAEQTVIDDAKRESVDGRVENERRAQQWLDEFGRLSDSDRAGAMKRLREDAPLAAAVKQNLEDEAAGLTVIDKQIRALPVKDGSRARAVGKLLNRLPENERLDYIRALMRKRVVSSDVIMQLVAADAGSTQAN